MQPTPSYTYWMSDSRRRVCSHELLLNNKFCLEQMVTDRSDIECQSRVTHILPASEATVAVGPLFSPVVAVMLTAVTPGEAVWTVRAAAAPLWRNTSVVLQIGYVTHCDSCSSWVPHAGHCCHVSVLLSRLSAATPGEALWAVGPAAAASGRSTSVVLKIDLNTRSQLQQLCGTCSTLLQPSRPSAATPRETHRL